MSKFNLTPEEQEAVNTYYSSAEEQPAMDEKEQKKNSINNLLGFAIAFFALILFGYLMIVVVSNFIG